MNVEEMDKIGKIKIKQFCFNCDTNLDDVIVTRESDMADNEFDWSGYERGEDVKKPSYVLHYKTCPNCNEKNVTYQYPLF